jgi:hypothetical protein
MAVETTMVTGRFVGMDGQPCAGTVTFTPPCTVRDNSGQSIVSGPISEALDSFGAFAVRVPCTDQDGLDPTGWCFQVTVRLDCADCVSQFPARIPCGRTTVPISELVEENMTTTDDCCGTVVLRGPKGDKGDPGPAGSTQVLVRDPITADGSGTEGDPYVISLALSPNPNNNLSLASDGGLYTPIPDGSETIVTAGNGTDVTGTGTTADPYVVASTVTAADLGAITSVTGSSGVASSTSGTDVTITADISTDEGNRLKLGADAGLYVAADTEIGDNTYVLGDTMVQSGSGTESDPYILNVSLSSDAGNALVQGSDGGLYVPEVASGVSSVTAADGTLTVTPATGDVQAAVNLSSDTANTITTGTDGGLYVPALTAGPGVILTGSTDTGYAVGIDAGYAYCTLAGSYTCSAGWAGAIPIAVVAASHAALNGNVLTLEQPGVWDLYAQLNANGNDTTGTLYVRISGSLPSGSNYTGMDYATGRRYGVNTAALAVSDGTTEIWIESQASRDSGNSMPTVNSAILKAVLVQPMTAAAAAELRASMPDNQRRLP